MDRVCDQCAGDDVDGARGAGDGARPLANRTPLQIVEDTRPHRRVPKRTALAYAVRGLRQAARHGGTALGTAAWLLVVSGPQSCQSFGSRTPTSAQFADRDRAETASCEESGNHSAVAAEGMPGEPASSPTAHLPTSTRLNRRRLNQKNRGRL